MKISFVSNLFNHHQKFLSENFYHLTNQNYCFIATMGMPNQLKNLGYQQFPNLPYVLNAFESDENKAYALSQIHDSDVVIYGSVPKFYIAKRERIGKLTFYYSERPLKDGNNPLMFFPRLLKWRLLHYVGESAYMLCASAFASSDYKKFGMYLHKCYKWGYFPEKRVYDSETLFSKKQKKKILWVGRFLGYKHLDDVLYVAKRLKDEGYSFSIDIGGTGEKEQQLREMAEDMRLSECVTFIGSIPSEQVRGYMEKAGIYLFTSDRHEGWGAVLNESMNSGCAVVASHAIGAVPYLVKHNENGLIYHSGNVNELYQRVKYLLDNPSEQERLGKAAYKTISTEWNSEVASERLIILAEHLLAGEKYPNLFSSGPCSRAEIIKDDWFGNN